MTRIINSAVKHTAQAYLCAEAETGTPSGACGSACGAGDENPNPSPPHVARLAVQVRSKIINRHHDSGAGI